MPNPVAELAANLSRNPELAIAVGLAAACLTAVCVIITLVLMLRPRKPATDPVAQQRLTELHARLDAMGSWLQNSHANLQQGMNARLDAVAQNLGESMKSTTRHTTEHLQQLHARLAVIDSAQKNITELASQVSSLQNVLSNKQSRGAFGQGQLEAIVADVLPKGAFEFQYTLSNRTRPDCVIFMPEAGPLVLDAKFPLEAITSWRDARTDEERKQAAARVRQDVGRHISDIAEKYLIPGETQDVALMFIPSESLYADLYENFDDLVQRARRARVMIVSPNMAFLAIQLVRQIRKDAEMQEAALTIRTEVGFMAKDVELLSERTRKLQSHFGQLGKDIDDILISAGKIEKRAARIEALEFDDDPRSGAEVIQVPVRRLKAGE